MCKNLLKSYLKYHKAFTLVELLVVISIIAVLLSILMPSLSKAREQAKKTICKSNMGHAKIAIDMYSIDNRDLIMPASTLVNRDVRGWFDLISGYIAGKNNDILYATAPQIPKNTLIVCPSNIMLQPTTVIYAVGFAMNARRGLYYGTLYGEDSFSDQWIKQQSIKEPHRKIVLSDARQQIPGKVPGELPASQRWKSIYWWTLAVTQYKPYDYYVGRNIHKDDGSNFLWSDGHVSNEPYKKWDTDPSTGWWAILNHN